MEFALLVAAQIVAGLFVFLVGAVIAASWLAGCLFLLDKRGAAFATIGFIIPPIGFAYAVLLIMRERTQERRNAQAT